MAWDKGPARAPNPEYGDSTFTTPVFLTYIKLFGAPPCRMLFCSPRGLYQRQTNRGNIVKHIFKQLALLTLLAASTIAQAFPTTSSYVESSRGFSYNVGAPGGVTGGGCFSSDSTRSYDIPGAFWVISLLIREDDCGDDELFITGSARHIADFGTPTGTTFAFNFSLDDNVDYPDGTAVLRSLSTFRHGLGDQDFFDVRLAYTVGGRSSDDFVSYALDLTGHHVPLPATLSLFLAAVLAWVLAHKAYRRH